MPSFNRVILAGVITKDVELKFTKGNPPTAVTEVDIAINEKVKKNGEWQDDVTYVGITIWGKNAENVEKYLGKGSSILVEGKLRLDRWPDKETGKQMQKLKVVAETVNFLDGKRKDQQESAPRQETKQQTSQTTSQSSKVDEDSLPF